jgi:hypothetical protein
VTLDHCGGLSRRPEDLSSAFTEIAMAKGKAKGRRSGRLLAEPQPDLFEKSYQERMEAEKNRPVECLGMTFPNDEKRQNRTGSVAPPEG